MFFSSYNKQRWYETNCFKDCVTRRDGTKQYKLFFMIDWLYCFMAYQPFFRLLNANFCWCGCLVFASCIWTPAYGQAKAGRPAWTYIHTYIHKYIYTYSSYVRIRDVALKTYQRRWIIGRSGERGSGISVLVARHDDDDIDQLLLEMLVFCLLNCF